MDNRNGYIDIDPANTDHLFSALPDQYWPDQWHPTDSYLQSPPNPDDDKFKQVLDDGLSFKPARANYRLGCPDLPVAPFREHITDTILDNTYSVFGSPTGTGKSSQTGLFLLEDSRFPAEGRIFFSSPRILAARQLNDWARKNLGPAYADQAGYLTGTTKDSDAGERARLFYVTEQMLFKMANRGLLGPSDIVINDEAHERGVGSIYLQGILKELIVDNPEMKLVISSATMNHQRHAEQFVDPRTGKPAAIIALEGTTHPITDIHTDRSVVDVAKEYMQSGNVLVFEPGEQRQLATKALISDVKNGHMVHILNANIPPSEQAAALTSEDKNHIIGNKTAETSLTPDGKDTVVDGGLSNIGKYEAGVRVLKTVHSSKDVMMQRRGRIGRTKPGNYIVAQPSNAPPIRYEDRDDYEISPIENSSVSSYITELLTAGRHTEKMDLAEYPTSENLNHDYKLLKRLGAVAMVDGELTLTPIGRAMNDLPLNSSLARMLVEARSIDEKYDVDVDTVRTQMAAATAIRQVNGILNAWNYSRHRYRLNKGRQGSMSNEHASDVLFELDVFIKAYEKHQKLIARGGTVEEDFVAYLRSKDIFVNRYIKAFDTFEEICLREGLDLKTLKSPEKTEREAIIGCQIAGTEELFVQKTKFTHLDIRGEARRLGRRSTIDPSLARLVIGEAFDLVGLRDTGHFRRTFVVGSSVVSTDQLLKHAPERVQSRTIGHTITPEGDVLEQQALYFDGDLLFDHIEVAPQPTLQTREFIIRAMMTGIARSTGKNGKQADVAYPVITPNAQNAIRRWRKAQELEHKSLANLRTSHRYEKLIKKVIRSSVEIVPLEVTDPHELDTVIPRVYMDSLVRPSKKRDIPAIIQRAPDAVSFIDSEENRVYLPVNYRNNIAYVTIPRGLEYQVQPQDIAGLAANHNVKIRIGDNGQYLQAEAMFSKIEEKKNAPQRQKRIQRREENSEKKSSPDTFHAAIKRLRYAKKNGKLVPKADAAVVKQKRVATPRRTRSRMRDKNKAILVSVAEAS